RRIKNINGSGTSERVDTSKYIGLSTTNWNKIVIDGTTGGKVSCYVNGALLSTVDGKISNLKIGSIFNYAGFSVVAVDNVTIATPKIVLPEDTQVPYLDKVHNEDDDSYNYGYGVESVDLSNYNAIKVTVNGTVMGGFLLSDVFDDSVLSATEPVSIGFQINRIPAALGDALVNAVGISLSNAKLNAE
ncbi:MAG: hypothetical protein IJT23_05110, partial [Clostridia bacterium]|nr:hypothetical protein [Clostridia bacterium]